MIRLIGSSQLEGGVNVTLEKFIQNKRPCKGIAVGSKLLQKNNQTFIDTYHCKDNQNISTYYVLYRCAVLFIDGKLECG